MYGFLTPLFVSCKNQIVEGLKYTHIVNTPTYLWVSEWVYIFGEKSITGWKN